MNAFLQLYLSYGSVSASLDFCSFPAAVILNVVNDSGSMTVVVICFSEDVLDFSRTDTTKFVPIVY